MNVRKRLSLRPLLGTVVGVLAAAALTTPLLVGSATAQDDPTVPDADCVAPVDPTTITEPTPITVPTTITEPTTITLPTSVPFDSPEMTNADDKKCPARTEVKDLNYGYTAKIADGKLVVTFTDGKACKVDSVEATDGKLRDDKVTVEQPVKDGEAKIKVKLTVKCGDDTLVYEGFNIAYDESINQIKVDVGDLKPTE
jgi:hypothetical protein